MGKMQAVQEMINVFVASVVSLAVLFILTRLGGKRQIAQMNLFDYVNSITIGSIAAEMATNLEQWYRPLTAMIVYGIAAFAVHYGTCKNRNVRLWLSGQAIPLMENGTIYKAELGRAKIDLNEFLAQARVAGYFDLNEVQCAMLETSGQISFLPKSFNRPVTPQDLAIQTDPASKWYDLVLDGKLIEEITAKELNEKCQCCLKIKASDTAQAAILIEKNLHTKNYEILSDNNIRIFEYVDNPGIVNSLLVNHGISVDECTVTKESLEDYFNEIGNCETRGARS